MSAAVVFADHDVSLVGMYSACQQLDNSILLSAFGVLVPYSYCYIVPCDDCKAYLVRYYYYSAVYISGSFTITDPIPGFQNIIIRVTDKAYMAESSSSGPRKFNALFIFIVCVLPILFFFFFFFFQFFNW